MTPYRAAYRLPILALSLVMLGACSSLPSQRRKENEPPRPTPPEVLTSPAKPMLSPEAPRDALPKEENRGASLGASSGVAAAVPERPPERPPRPLLPVNILGTGAIPAKTLAAFLLSANPAAPPALVSELSRLYVEEAKAEGVNHDVAFAQMCLETGYLRFGGLVTEDMHNYCGLGAMGPEARGERFGTVQLGVRAHIQHLKGYATDAPLFGALVDPRYKWVKHGSSPTIDGLARRWASDPLYGEKIRSILERLYTAAFPPL